MIVKTITYEDYTGAEVTEDFYFHMTKAEIVELELSVKEGFAETLQRIIKSQNPPELIEYFKKIILVAYGQKTANGKGFVKSQEMRDEFATSEAYSELFMELATNAEAASDFVNRVLPKNLGKDVETAAEQTVELPTAQPVLEEAPEDTRPAWIREDRDPTQEELTRMPREELLLAMKRKNQ